MKLLIDDANVNDIREIVEFYPIDGVTTNPSILAKSGRNPYEVLKEIRSIIGNKELHVQAVSLKAEDMVKEAHYISEQLGENTYVKIPSIPEGFKAMKVLCDEGLNITATAVYTPMQAYIAAKCGAKYVAPYINRIDNMGYDGVGVAIQIQDIFNQNDMQTEILAASFKNSQQVLELCKVGVGASTVAPDVIKGFVNNPAITSAVQTFVDDFEGLCGEGSTMLNCK